MSENGENGSCGDEKRVKWWFEQSASTQRGLRQRCEDRLVALLGIGWAMKSQPAGLVERLYNNYLTEEIDKLIAEQEHRAKRKAEKILRGER